MMQFESGEIVRVFSSKRNGYPMKFDWRGGRHRICSIEHYQNFSRRSKDEVEQYRHFLIRTTRGLRCLLIQDVSREIWQMHPMLRKQGGEA